MKALLTSLLAASLLLTVTTSLAEPVDFELPDLTGKKQRLSDYRGKWVVVNYWATWCPPCLEEMPDLDDFHVRHKDKDAVVLGVNMEDIGVDQLSRFVDSLMVSYPILRDKPRPFTELGNITGMPTSFIVSPEGEVVAYQVGIIRAQDLDAFLARKAGKVSSKD